MKDWECVQVDHHNKIVKVIEEYQEKGWHLRTYQAAGIELPIVMHYLLFERETSS